MVMQYFWDCYTDLTLVTYNDYNIIIPLDSVQSDIISRPEMDEGTLSN